MKKIQIIKIIDDYQVIINAGSEHEIKKGDTFKILDKEAEKITDPFNGEFLGFINGVKDFIKAKEVQEKMTICESLTEDINIFSIANPFKITEKKRLNVDLTQVTGEDSMTSSTIEIGDEVEKI